MKFKEYMDHLSEIVLANPEVLAMDVIYCKDDEGNGYQLVAYNPSLGKDEDMEFEITEGRKDYNAICIN